MKKIAAALIVIISVFMCFGCTLNPEKPVENKVPSQPEPGRSVEFSGENGDLKIYCFELGKADSFLIYNDKTAILIDAGERGQGKDIIKYMENNGITKLDYMFITHFDKDHVGGAAKVIGSTEVGRIYTSNYPKISDEYNNFLERIKEKNVPTQELRENLRFNINDIGIEVNVPAKAMYEVDPSNNSSLIIRITYGENSFLFTGDAQAERLRDFMVLSPPKCDVLKMPYHGNFMGCLPELLDMLDPKYAVITSSKEEKEAEETMKLLEDRDVTVFRTREGGVLIKSDGKEISTFQED